MHKDCYNHPTIHAYDLLICDILLLANETLYNFKDMIEDPHRYLKLDDTILDEIRFEAERQTDNQKLQQAKELLDRMDFRQHYKCVGEKGLNKQVALSHWNEVCAAAIVAHAPAGSTLRVEDLGVRKFKINHGLGSDQPLYNVRFYDKKEICEEGIVRSYKLDRRVLESKVPKENQTWIVRCFVKPWDQQKWLDGQQAFSEYCKTVLGGDSLSTHLKCDLS